MSSSASRSNASHGASFGWSSTQPRSNRFQILRASVQRFSPFLALLLAILLNGCATSRPVSEPGRAPFQFGHDTFAFDNELVWEYSFDEEGRWSAERRKPRPDYTHHCFVVVCAAKQFFNHALFGPDQPRADEQTYRQLVREVVERNPRKISTPEERIVFPGFADLHEFSREHEALLKDECGGAWESYVQRGHWRCVLPFTRRHQEQTADELTSKLDAGHPIAVHLMRFPQLSINHALLLFDYERAPTEIRFTAYDPNDADVPSTLVYDHRNRTFYLPANDYFYGGRVDVYEIYHRWNY